MFSKNVSVFNPLKVLLSGHVNSFRGKNMLRTAQLIKYHKTESGFEVFLELLWFKAKGSDPLTCEGHRGFTIS